MNLTIKTSDIRISRERNLGTSPKPSRIAFEQQGSSGALKRAGDEHFLHQLRGLYFAILVALFLPCLALSQTDWASLGSPAGPLSQYNPDVNSPVSVATNQNGTLEVFVIGHDGAVWHTWQFGWNWFSLGIPDPSRPLFPAGPIAAGKNQDGRLEAFVADLDGGIWHNWQLWPEGPWAGWNFLWQLPANYLPTSLAVANNSDGRLELFTAGGEVGHIWQLPNGGGWSSWNSLGVPPRGSNLADIGAITAVRDGFNQLNVFLTQDDPAYANGSNVWFNSQIGPGGGWSGWQPLSSPSVCCGRYSSPAVGINKNGTMEVFVGGFDGSVWHRWQVGGQQNWNPIGWVSLGPPVGPGFQNFTVPAVASNSDKRLETFATGVDGALWHNWQVAPEGAWSGWYSLGIAPGTSGMAARTVVGVNGDGRLEVFNIASDSLWHAWQITPSGGW